MFKSDKYTDSDQGDVEMDQVEEGQMMVDQEEKEGKVNSI
jgi:hypothetical protein